MKLGFLRWTCLVSSLFSWPLLAGGKIVVEFDSDDWTPEQQRLIQNAANIVKERMASAAVRQCALRYSTRGIPNREEWDKKMSLLRNAKQIKLKINKGVTRGSALGQARVGKAKLGDREEGFTGLEISLNDSHVNYAYLDKKMLRHPDPSQQRYEKEGFWSEIISHEMAHNLGLDHGRDGDWETAYKGYFITELGACVKTAGKQGSYDLSKSPKK